MKKIYLLLLTYFFASSNLISQSFTWAKTYSVYPSGSIRAVSVQVDALGNVYDLGFFSGTVDFDPGPSISTLTATGVNDMYLVKLNSSGSFVWAKRIGGSGQIVPQKMNIDASANLFIAGYFTSAADFDPNIGTYNLTPIGLGDGFTLKIDMNGNFLWANSVSGLNSDYTFSAVTDPSGNIVSVGSFSNSVVDFDPGVGTYTLQATGGANGYVSKLDASGNFIWAKKFGIGTCYVLDVKTDAAGNVYSTGYFQSTIDFDPGPATYNMTSAGSIEAFVSKLDAAGNFVWAKQLGGIGYDDASSLALDAAANVYVVGRFGATSDFDPGPGSYTIALVGGASDAFISKLDANGNFVWAKAIAGNSIEAAEEVTLDASGNVLTCGYFSSVVDFDPGTGTYNLTSPSGASEAFISKLDANGNFIGANRLGNTGSDYAYGITSDAASNIYLNGAFTSTVDFDPGSGIYNMVSSGSSFILKWAGCSSAPSTPSTIIGLTSVCTGAASTNYSVNPIAGASSYNWNLPSGWSGTSTNNTIMVMPGSSGVLSITATNPCGTSLAQTLSVTVNPLPSITISGNTVMCTGETTTLTANGAITYTWNNSATSNTIAVSPTITTSYSVTGTDNNSCSDVAITTMSVSPCIGINELSNIENTIIIYPNPTSGYLTINSENLEINKLQIFNLLSEEVYFPTTYFNGSSVEINLSHLPKGIYVIRIGQLSKKIIKE